MWTLLSFTGRFDVEFLQESIAKGENKAPPNMPGEITEAQKQKTRDANMARSRYRRDLMLQHLQDRLARGNKKGKPLNSEQKQVLEELQSGELLRKANQLTLISGHGRLKREDNSFLDIGGNTGGFVRTVLDDWEPPNVTEFE